MLSYSFRFFKVIWWCSVVKLCLTLCDPMDCSTPRVLCPPLSTTLCSNSCPLSQWCSPTISPLPPPFSFCLQSFLASGSFPMSQRFASGGQNIGASASASVFPMNTEDWFPLGLTGVTSLHSKGLSRLISSITIQKYQFFGTKPSLWSNSHTYTWLLEKT